MRLAVILFFALLPLLASPARAETIEVTGGTIEGITLDSGVRAWLGVPFAAPPVRDLRWRPPQPVVPWKGTYHADRPAPQCLQPLRSPRQNHYFGNEATSEDCLYLNIWAPAGERHALPVVVWIYGGGFNIGSASMANYSGEGLAAHGVIRVNLAYRLGALGFLAHPELSRESGQGASGNYGLLDLVAGLRWIQDNIARFGGDPGNVTLVGQSAGAMAISILQQSPLTRGLFHRAVAMSGSNFGGMVQAVPLQAAEQQGLALQAELGAASLADLRAVPGDRVVAASTRRDPFVIDNYVVTGSAEAVFAAGRQQDVPVMLGYTRDESFRPLGPVNTLAELRTELTSRFGEQAEQVLQAYPGADADPARSARDIARDSSVGLQMALWARAQAEHGHAPVYGYFFTRRHPYAEGITFSDHDPATAGAYHTGDVPYWLRTRESLNLFRTTRVWEQADAALEDEMAGALLAFARTGIPRSPRIGDWPSFLPQAPRVVELSLDPKVIAWPNYLQTMLFVDTAAPMVPRQGAPRD